MLHPSDALLNSLRAEVITSFFNLLIYFVQLSSIDFINVVCWTEGISVTGMLSFLIASLNKSAVTVIHGSMVIIEFGKHINCSSIKRTKT